MALVIRTSSDPEAMTSSVRQQLRKLDPGLPIFNVQSMQDVLNGSVAQPRFRTFLLSMFAGLALVLAALGLYGVVAYSVSQRTTELAIRVALGAQPSSILQLVVFRAAGLAAIGLAIGIAASSGREPGYVAIFVWYRTRRSHHSRRHLSDHSAGSRSGQFVSRSAGCREWILPSRCARSEKSNISTLPRSNGIVCTA